VATQRQVNVMLATAMRGQNLCAVRAASLARQAATGITLGTAAINAAADWTRLLRGGNGISRGAPGAPAVAGRVFSPSTTRTHEHNQACARKKRREGEKPSGETQKKRYYSPASISYRAAVSLSATLAGRTQARQQHLARGDAGFKGVKAGESTLGGTVHAVTRGGDAG